MAHLDDLGVTDGEMVDGIEGWIAGTQQEDGSTFHPETTLKAYPHAPW